MNVHIWDESKVTYERHSNRNYENLSRGNPEGPTLDTSVKSDLWKGHLCAPFASEVFGDDSNKSLDAPKDGSVNNDRPGWLVATVSFFRSAVFQVESLRKLEVKLDSRALEGSAECVADFDVNLGSIERAVAGVQFPFAWVLLFQRTLQLL